MADFENDATSLDLTTDEQQHATQKSVLAMAPDDLIFDEPVSMDEVRAFVMDQDADKDRQEAKRDGATVANYYFGRLQMQELEEHLRVEFPETWKSKFKVTENFTKSTARQLSTIYKSAPKREAAPKRNSVISPSGLADQTEIIEFVYSWGQLNRSFQEIERFAKWAKSVLIEVMFQPGTGKIVLKPYSPQFYDVMVSKSGVLQAVIISDYCVNIADKNEADKRKFWVWTATERAQFEGSEMNRIGEIQPNPLGFIPFVFHNDDLPVENEKSYLHADTMLSNANLAINRSLTDAMSLIKNKTYGQPYIIGGDPDALPAVTGHEEIWHIRRGRDEDSPVVGLLSPSGDLDSILKMVERIANGYATSRGLAPDSFTATKTGQTQSGIALKIKNHVLLEMRDAEEAKYQDLENRIFEVVRGIHNFHTEAEGGTDLPPISEDIKLSVHFEKNDLAFENPVEVRRQMLVEVGQNLMKRSDFVRASKPHLSEDEALEHLIAIKEENDQLGVTNSLASIDQMLSNTGDDDEEEEADEES